MIDVRVQSLRACLWISLVCGVGSSAAAQTTAGESANFSSFMGEVDADLQMIEPACTNCGTLVVEEAAKGGADATPSVTSMEDETTLEFAAQRPESVSGGPDPVVSSFDDELDGLEYEMTTTDEEIKASPLKLIRKTRIKVKVKPDKRAKFPAMDMADACDPAKPFNKTQKGWRTLRLSSVAKKKNGRTLVSKARTVKVCVRNPPAQPKTCALSCGQGSCQQAFTGGQWKPTCACTAGYKFDGKTCVDIDECKSGAKCPSGQECNNTVGSFQCACGAGKVLTATGCRAANACETIKCRAGLSCKVTSVGGTCACPKPGDALVAGVCKPTKVCGLNSCGLNPGISCADNSTDSAIPPGEFSCRCPVGTVRQGEGKAMRCVDIDECRLGNVASFCRNACRNVDSSGSRPAPFGATCGTDKLPPAPSPKSVFNIKTKTWQ